MAGRPKGQPKTGGRVAGMSKNKATKEAKIALEDLAKEHTQAALNALVNVAKNGKSEAAVVSAALGLLDRGYGKPRQAVDMSGQVSINTMSDAELDARLAELRAKA